MEIIYIYEDVHREILNTFASLIVNLLTNDFSLYLCVHLMSPPEYGTKIHKLNITPITYIIIFGNRMTPAEMVYIADYKRYFCTFFSFCHA